MSRPRVERQAPRSRDTPCSVRYQVPMPETAIVPDQLSVNLSTLKRTGRHKVTRITLSEQDEAGRPPVQFALLERSRAQQGKAPPQSPPDPGLSNLGEDAGTDPLCLSRQHEGRSWPGLRRVVRRRRQEAQGAANAKTSRRGFGRSRKSCPLTALAAAGVSRSYFGRFEP